MGGGDLNSKKSWHPNTIKNQERVWKAEQAAAEEKKRILELQHERGEERNRAELNEMVKRNAGVVDDNRLHWMYDKPDKKVQQEDYLLGKAIDKGGDQSDKPEPDAIPAVARRVVGSSMLATAGDSQVDIARKLREDPLLLIKERERAARAALLNNPLQRRRLTELLRKEQEQKKDHKEKKNTKKKERDLDNMLAVKINALGGNKGINLAALLDSENSSSDSSSEEEKSKKKKKKKKHKVKRVIKKSKKKKHSIQTDEASSDDNRCKVKSKKKKRHSSETDRDTPADNRKKVKTKEHMVSISENRRHNASDSRKRKSESVHEESDKESRGKRTRNDSIFSKHRRSKSEQDIGLSQSRNLTGERTTSFRKRSPEQDKYASRYKRREGLSEEERAARLAAMAAAGAEREVERGRRVAHQRAVDEVVDARAPRRLVRNEARALPDSLEDRIHSNRHYIQRDQRHMSEHFARR